MTTEQENKYWGAFKVIVQKQKISDKSICPVKSCKKHQVYTIFVGDSCRLSTLYETSCKNHLSLQVDKSIAYRNKIVASQIERAKKREIEDAEKLLKAV